MFDLSAFLTNITNELPSINLLVTAVAYVMGATFGIMSLTKAAQHAKSPEQVTLSQVVSPFVVAVCLMWLPTAIGTFAMTTFGTLDPTPLSYVVRQKTGLTSAALAGALGLVKLFGLIAFIRGIVMLKKIGEGKEGGDALSRAIWHMFGGIMLYYIEGTANILSSLFIPR